MKIKIEHQVNDDRLKELSVTSWPIWSKEQSEFPWHYDSDEICYLLEGEVEVIPEDGKPVKFGKGDLVSFPKGMSCQWKIHKDVKKYYKLG
jgi:uncharacterized protein